MNEPDVMSPFTLRLRFDLCIRVHKFFAFLCDLALPLMLAAMSGMTRETPTSPSLDGFVVLCLAVVAKPHHLEETKQILPDGVVLVPIRGPRSQPLLQILCVGSPLLREYSRKTSPTVWTSGVLKMSYPSAGETLKIKARKAGY